MPLETIFNLVKMKNLIISCLLIFCIQNYIQAQKLTSTPSSPSVNDEVVVRFYIDSCENKALDGYTGDIYVHTGVYVKGKSNWEYVIAEWSENIEKAKCSRISTNVYEITITPDITGYYGIQSGDTVTSMNFVVRSSDGSKQTEDLFQVVYETGLTVEITKPEKNLIVLENDQIHIRAQAINIGTPLPDHLNLYLDDKLIHTSSTDTINHYITATEPGIHWIKVEGESGTYSHADSVFYFVKNESTPQDLPGGVTEGINYTGDSSVSLVLYAPYKENVFVIGDFNDWGLDNNYQMTNTTDGDQWWLVVDSLDPEKEYAFQYLVDGNLRIADPYSKKILDPWNDDEIPATTFPELKAYPEGKTSEIVSVLKINDDIYPWAINNFEKPNITDLVIYELHIQNFTEAGNIKKLIDTLGYLSQLGVNAIEVMPVNEFEGNKSWGYNPSYYFAIDKNYGRHNDFKAFVDSCHQMGMAVIVDMVLNHSFGQSPLVRLYWDESKNKPAANNPWFNQEPTHDFNVGYDMNHESEQTRAFAARVMKYWLEEFKIDGFRFDLAKGFTQKNTLGNSGAMAQYDPSRIAIWKYYADTIWSISEDAIIILEHFADNSEEKELANYGMLLWGNMNSNFNEATMGYTENNKSDLSWAFYTSREWDNPNAVIYMESHDEERLMYKNKTYGNSNDIYSVKETGTGLQRLETAAAFFFTVPGPKMIWEFGELGYDYSINTCESGIIGDCRLDLKPIRWDYYDEAARYRLFKIYEALIDFKELSICRTDDLTFDVTGALKAIHLNGTDTNATIIGNFDIYNREIDPNFQHTGEWYNYITGDTLNVADISSPILLRPGEYMILTDIPLDVITIPDGSDIPNVTNINSAENSNYNVFPNPVTNSKIYIQTGTKNQIESGYLEIYNTNGQIILKQKIKYLSGNLIEVDLENILPQVLTYRLTLNSETTHGIIIKQ